MEEVPITVVWNPSQIDIAASKAEAIRANLKEAIKAARADGTSSMEVTSTMKKYLEQTLLHDKSLEEIAQVTSKSGFEEVRRVHNRIQKNPVWQTMRKEYDKQWTEGEGDFLTENLHSLFDMLNNKGIGYPYPAELSYTFMAQEYAQASGQMSFHMADFVKWLNKKNIDLDEEEVLMHLRRVQRKYDGIVDVAHTSYQTLVTMLQEGKEVEAVATLTEIAPLAKASWEEQSILKASNLQDLTKNLKNSVSFRGVTIDKSVGTIDIQAFKESLTGVQRVLDRFPALRHTLQKVTVVDEGNSTIMSCAFTGNGCTLNFNTGVYKTYQAAVDDCINVNSVGKRTSMFHPRMEDLTGVPIHEMGHVIEAHLIINTPGVGVAEKYEMWSKGKIPQDIVRKAIAAVKKTPDGYYSVGGTARTALDLRGEISQYAEYTTGETIAEALCDWFSNGEKAAPLSKAIMQEIERRMAS